MDTLNRKIMVVDDDREFLDELKDTLQLSGYDLVAVNDSGKALDVASQEKPDLILVDLKMPEKSGFQLADELRHLQEFTHVPIIAMTAFFKDEYSMLLNICGVKKCLRKPFTPLDIIHQIEEELEQK